MCGLAGIVGLSARCPPPGLIAALSDSLAHRGPDDYAYLGWAPPSVPQLSREVDGLAGSRVLFAHRRLAIIDTSLLGRQPMLSDDAQHAIAFNGEIYNYVELRAELTALGHRFVTASDTEVLLKGWLEWGETLLPRLIGMFAFAILDCRRRRLIVARDPFGIKPLYWTTTASAFAFASEIKSLLRLNGVDRRVDAQGLYDYLRLGRTDCADGTLLAGVRRLPAAHWAEIDLDEPVVEPRRYWSIDANARSELSFEQAAERLRELFLASVGLHLRSDVPVGAALSGGIDSSAVVMAMRRLSGDDLDLHAFSYVAADPTLNEERWIDLVGDACRATVHKVRLTPHELAADLDTIIDQQDEPFGSTSILAQYYVYGLAKRAGIKVTMDGQGADEMLGGYPVYFAARLAGLVKAGQWAEAAGFVKRAAALGNTPARAILLKAGRWLLPSALHGPARWLAGERLVPDWLDGDWFRRRGACLAERLAVHGRTETLRAALLDSFAERSLPALLRYGDRNAMAHSVESRVPFLSPPLVEFVFSLPAEQLIDRQGTTKSVFRVAMRGIVPDAVLARRDKIGFVTPQRDWLTALAPWVETVLAGPAARAIPPLRHRRMIERWQRARAAGHELPGETWRWLNLIRWSERVDARFEG
jgi:asparagine synthase (glutamine-hydrolysing)